MAPKLFAWTAEIEAEIFDRLAKGEAIRKVCADDWMPGWTTVNKRLMNDAAFAAHYARAREEQADTIFDEIIGIADAATPEDAQVARVKIDARKWVAGKLRPKVYGDKLDVAHSGGITINVADAFNDPE